MLKEVTEDLDPSLKPILLQNTFVKGGHTLIKIGDTEIEYNNNFRLAKLNYSNSVWLQRSPLVMSGHPPSVASFLGTDDLAFKITPRGFLC